MHKVIKENGDRFCLENNISEDQRATFRGRKIESDSIGSPSGRSSTLISNDLSTRGRRPEINSEGPTRSSNALRPGFTYTMSSNGVLTEHAQPSSYFTNINEIDTITPLEEINESSHIATPRLLDDDSES